MITNNICQECLMLTKPNPDGTAEFHPYSYCRYYKQASNKTQAAGYLHQLAQTKTPIGEL